MITFQRKMMRIWSSIFSPKELRSRKDIASFWNYRYLKGGDSGAGSYGAPSKFKAQIVNKFIDQYRIQTIIDYGCGDGNQVEQFNLTGVDYLGLDVARKAIEICRSRFKTNHSMRFEVLTDYSSFEGVEYDLALSLDVIYHLVDDVTYFEYLDALFNSARYVLIYSTNRDDPNWSGHSRPRRFLEDVMNRYPNFKFLETIPSSIPQENDTAFFLFHLSR